MTDSGSKGIPARWLLLLTAEAVAIMLVFSTLLFAGYVTSSSMEPAISRNAVVLGRRPVIAGAYRRGDIVLFAGENGNPFVKRIVGLPGETVGIAADGAVTIDGIPLAEPYVVHQQEGYSGEFEVPRGCFLLLGDNRAGSYDSRFWGQPYVAQERIIAKIFH